MGFVRRDIFSRGISCILFGSSDQVVTGFLHFPKTFLNIRKGVFEIQFRFFKILQYSGQGVFLFYFYFFIYY